MGCTSVITGIPRQPPRRIGRPALDARLANAVETTVVRAPSGYGKTTVVTGWARRSSYAGLWITVGEPYSRSDEFREILSSLHSEAGPASITAPARSGSDSAAAPTILIIDGADYLTETDADAVAELRAAVGNLRVVLISRTQSVMEQRALSKTPAQVQIIERSDLQLNARDAQAVLVADAVAAPLAVAGSLSSAVGGSVKLLRMVAEELGAGTTLRDIDLAAQPLRGAAAAVVRRLISAEDNSLVTFALRTVLADELTPMLSIALGDGLDQVTLVPELVAKGFGRYGGLGLTAEAANDFAAFEISATSHSGTDVAQSNGRGDSGSRPDHGGAQAVELNGGGHDLRQPGQDRRSPVPRENVRFRYFPVVAAGLRTVLAGRDSGLVKSIRQRIVRWARDENEYPTLFSQYVLGGDLERASRLALSHWREILFGAGTDAASAMQTVPRATIVQHPPLLMLLALITAGQSGNNSRTVDFLNIVATGSEVYRSRLAPEWRAVFSTMQSTALLMIGKNDAAAKSARSAANAIESLTPTQSVVLRDQLPSLKNEIATTLFHCGDDIVAIALVEEAISDSVSLRADDRTAGAASPGAFGIDLRSITIAGAYLHNLALLAWIRANRGEIAEATVILARINSTDWPTGVLDSPCAAAANLAAALVAIEAQDWSSASVAISAARNNVASDDQWGSVDALDAIVALGVGESQRARSLMEAATRRGRSDSVVNPLMTEWLEAIRLVTGIATGSQISQSITSPIRASAGLDRARRVSAARLALTMGDSGQAERLVEPVLTATEASPRQLCDALLITAAAQLRKSAPASSAQSVLTVAGAPSDHTPNQTDQHTATSVRARSGPEARTRVGQRSVRSRDTKIAWLLGRSAAVIQEHRMSASIVLLSPPDLTAIEETAKLHSDPRVREHLGSTARLSLLRSEPVVRGILTRRERVVLSELTVSASVAEIASTLFVSPNTVKSQLRTLYKKLGVGTRGEALEVAKQLGLLEPGERQRRG